MKKTVILAALNAKYIHSNLALRYLSKFQNNNKLHHIKTMEFTINQRIDFIVEELFWQHPDVVLFSCYIWNVEMLRQICPILKKILPHCKIGFGGPEVSYESETFLLENPTVDFVIRGEGEQVFTEYLGYLDHGIPENLSDICGITYRDCEQILSTPQQPPLDLSLLPFPYEDNFHDVENQIIYYESSRGCPYQCGYCLSSIEQGVRFVPLSKVLPDLQKFLDANVKQVKFIDRTFNCSKVHAMAIWKYLHEHDNGITNFHFEITADRIDAETIAFLKTVRKGLFQFEIGVQSTNPKTISAIRRNVNFDALSDVVKQIKEGGNIHQHLDLIAGLPYENYASFAQSFNNVYALAPEQLQLGFLKVLKGSMLHQKQKDYKIVYHDTAPYEVLTTHVLPFSDTLRLKYVEEMVEIFYNSGKFIHTLLYLVPQFDTPFIFYEKLSLFWLEQQCHYRSLSKLGLCDFLRDFVQQNPKIDSHDFVQNLKYDLLLHEKPRKLPAWLPDDTQSWKSAIQNFYHSREEIQKYLPHYVPFGHKVWERQTHIDVFEQNGKEIAILFDYGQKDLLGNAQTIVLPHILKN